MQRNVLISAVVLALIGLAALWAFAAEPETGAKLTPVTVALRGVTCPSCAARLQHALSNVAGVSGVKATFKPQQVTATLDEKKISAAAFTRTVAATLAKIDGPKTRATLAVYLDAKMCQDQPKMCPPCFTEIPKVLNGVTGIKAVTLDETGKIATLTFDKDANVTTTAIANALAKSAFGFITTFTAPEKGAEAEKRGAPAGACTMGGCCAH